MPVSRNASRLSVMFDDDHAVADAGLALVGVLSEKLGLIELAEEMVNVPPFPGRRIATLVHAICAGASHIDHANVRRAGATGSVLGHRVMAPSTLGTFLRSFTFGHVRQLEAVIVEVLRRAWAMGAGPESRRLVVDVDSTICEVAGSKNQGASFGYTKVRGEHPLLATRADTGEVLHARLARARRTPGAGCGASSRSSCPGFVAPGPAASSWCAAILALGRTTRWPSGPPR
jgi:hypothetical protein